MRFFILITLSLNSALALCQKTLPFERFDFGIRLPYFFPSALYVEEKTAFIAFKEKTDLLKLTLDQDSSGVLVEVEREIFFDKLKQNGSTIRGFYPSKERLFILEGFHLSWIAYLWPSLDRVDRLDFVFDRIRKYPDRFGEPHPHIAKKLSEKWTHQILARPIRTLGIAITKTIPRDLKQDRSKIYFYHLLPLDEPTIAISHCDEMTLTHCFIDRVCLLKGNDGERYSAVTMLPEGLGLYHSGRHELQVFDTKLCSGFTKKMTYNLPKQIPTIAAMSYSTALGQLFLLSSKPDDYNQSGLFHYKL